MIYYTYENVILFFNKMIHVSGSNQIQWVDKGMGEGVIPPLCLL